MKYTSANKINDFEFHDAYFKLIGFENGDLSVSAKFLNIHKTSADNPNSKDMQIKEAVITFKNFNTDYYKEGDATTTKLNGERETTIFNPIIGNDALNVFLQEIEDGITVYYLGKESDGTYTIDACGISPYFSAKLSFSDIIICWNDFLKPAWYELHKQFKYPVILTTPEGDITTDLIISQHEGDVYYQGKLEKGPTVNAGLKLNGKEYWGHSADKFWVTSIVDLMKKLPDKTRLKGCLACKHGNFCPYGNERGTVFCTKDEVITSKEDVINLFDQEHETIWTERVKKYTDICGFFEEQTDECYTYNDYLYLLNK